MPYPIVVEGDYPEAGIARWRPFVQWWLLVIPHWIVLYFLAIGAGVVHLIAAFAIIFTRKYPRGMFDFSLGYLRWATRVYGFAGLMTEEYPPFSLD